MLEPDGDRAHCCARVEALPSQQTGHPGREPPDRNRLGCNRHCHRERRALSGRADCPPHPLYHPAPRSGPRIVYVGAGLRAYYLSPEQKKIVVWTQHPSITQGIASILVFIRMAYLLHAPDEWILSEAKSEVPSTSRPVTNNLGRNRSTTTTPKGSALLIADEMHISNIKWKPSSGDLGSNSESVENAATV
jgi:hypothetical protein